MKRRAVVYLMVLVLTGLAACCAAQGDEGPVLLRYAPQAGERVESAVSGKLTQLSMSGAPVQLTAEASGTVKQEILEVDAETGDFDARITVTVEKAEFAGQPRDLSSPRPIEATISSLGEIVKRPGVAESAQDDQGRAGALVTEGVPLDVIAAMAAWVQLPEEAVSVGDTWTTEDEQEFPLVGRCTVTTTTRLDRMEGRRAILVSDTTLTLPPSEIDNPWFQGKIRIETGTFKAQGVERELDLNRGVVVRAQGRLTAELQVDIGAGMLWPVTATIEFALEPRNEDAEAASAPEKPTELSAGTPATAKPVNKTASRELQVGPLWLDAELDEGLLSLRTGVDLSRVPLPPALRPYKPLLSLLRAGTCLEIGVAGPAAGQVGVAVEGQAGRYILDRNVRADLRSTLGRLLELRRSVLPQLQPQP